MFTVMHERDDGTKMLYACAQAEYLPARAEGGATVHCLVGPNEAAPGIFAGTLFDGNVYVMNDKGATVGRFYLGKPKKAPIS